MDRHYRSLAAAALLLVGILAAAANDDVAALAAQFRAGPAAARDAAAAKLLEIGPAARDAVRTLLDSTDGPTREAAAKIWHDLRWAVVPGGWPDTRALLAAADGDGVSTEQWRRFIRSHGVATADLILALLEDPRYALAGQEGFGHFLHLVPPNTAAEHFATYEEPSRTELLGLLDRFGHGSAVMPVLAIHRAMGNFTAAFELARDVWLAELDQALIPPAVGAVRDGKLGRLVWPQAGEQLYLDPKPDRRLRLLAFYVYLAAGLDDPAKVRSLLAITPVDGGDAKALQLIVDKLAELGFTDSVRPLLDRLDTPATDYLRARLELGNDQPLPDDRWQEILATVETEAEAADLIEQLGAHHDTAHSLDVWWKILDLDPKQSVYDVNALMQIALAAERDGNFKRAAEYYEQMLDMLQKTPLHLPEDKVKAMRQKVAELRQTAADDSDGFAAAMRRGRNALVGNQPDEALAQFAAAVKLRPNDRDARLMYYETCKGGSFWDALVPAATAVLALEPATDEERLNWAVIAIETDQLARGGELLARVAASQPDWPRLHHVRGLLLERQGEYRAAAAAIQAAVDAGLDTTDIRRSLGVAWAEAGELERAVATFEMVLVNSTGPDYCRLWLTLLRRRLGLPEQPPLEVSSPRDDAWLGRLDAFANGKLTADELLAAARTAARNGVVRGQLCEAWFCIAQQRLATGDVAGARDAFTKCRDQGVVVFIEYVWAGAELNRL